MTVDQLQPVPDPARFAGQPDATFWSEADEVYVTVYVGSSRFEVWDAYRRGLQECYRTLGVEHIVTDELVRPEDSSLVWLIRDRDWRVVGGARAVGPFRSRRDLDRVPAMAELAQGATPDVLAERLGELIEDGGIVELKGGWTHRSVRGLGPVVGCFGWFCTWWFDVAHAVATAGSENNLRRWAETGAVPFEGFEPVRGYPAEQYDTEPMVWSRARLDTVPERHRRFLWSAVRQLHGARARNLGMEGVPELVHRPERLAQLRADGVQLVDATPDLREQAAELRPPLELGDDAGWPWVYYPWRGRAVRVFGERDFHRLRTDRNRHKLTDDELGRLRTKTVAIVGMSVGSAIAHAMAQEGLCGRLRIADHDALELPNLNRLSASLLDLGENKAVLAARRMSELDPYLELVVEADGVGTENIDRFLAEADLVIEECDSLDVKVLVREQAAALGIPVVMETNDRGLLDIERFDLEPDRPLFHGLVDVPDSAELAELATEDKVPFVLDILDSTEISARTAASMVEIDRTVSSWPQLGSEVALGAALACQAAKSVLLQPGGASGRVRVDLAQLVERLDDPRPVGDPEPMSDPVRIELPSNFEAAVFAAAELAPSGGNAQPWDFALRGDRFEVFERPDGLAMDVQARGTAVACGAALFNAACVAAAHGRLDGGTDAIDTTLDLDRPDLVGSLRIGRGTVTDLAALAPTLAGRVTNRRLDPEPTALDSGDVARLAAATGDGGARLVYVGRDQLDELVELWAESDRLRFLNARLHREMFEELKDPMIDAVDVGLDARTLELSPGDAAKLGILRRGDVMAELAALGLGDQLRTDMRKRLAGSSGMVVVVAPGADRAAYVRGGMAMQRMWLEASRIGIEVQPVSPIFGYAKSPADFDLLLGTDAASAGRRLQDEAWQRLGIEAEESFILSMRVHRSPAATAVSTRRARIPMTTAR